MRSPRPCITLVILFVGLLAVTPGRADEIFRTPEESLRLLPGLNLAGSSSLDLGTGFSMGGELSLVYWTEPYFVGLVADGIYDWQRERGRYMLGAEAGWGPLGIEGGYLVESGAGGPYHGLAVRLFFSLHVFDIFVRYGGVFEQPDFVEWGVLLKLPISLFNEYPRRLTPIRRTPEERAKILAARHKQHKAWKKRYQQQQREQAQARRRRPPPRPPRVRQPPRPVPMSTYIVFWVDRGTFKYWLVKAPKAWGSFTVLNKFKTVGPGVGRCRKYGCIDPVPRAARLTDYNTVSGYFNSARRSRRIRGGKRMFKRFLGQVVLR